jgi:hypothetical protein
MGTNTPFQCRHQLAALFLQRVEIRLRNNKLSIARCTGLNGNFNVSSWPSRYNALIAAADLIWHFLITGWSRPNLGGESR